MKTLIAATILFSTIAIAQVTPQKKPSDSAKPKKIISFKPTTPTKDFYKNRTPSSDQKYSIINSKPSNAGKYSAMSQEKKAPLLNLKKIDTIYPPQTRPQKK